MATSLRFSAKIKENRKTDAFSSIHEKRPNRIKKVATPFGFSLPPTPARTEKWRQLFDSLCQDPLEPKKWQLRLPILFAMTHDKAKGGDSSSSILCQDHLRSIQAGGDLNSNWSNLTIASMKPAGASRGR